MGAVQSSKKCEENIQVFWKRGRGIVRLHKKLKKGRSKDTKSPVHSNEKGLVLCKKLKILRNSNASWK